MHHRDMVTGTTRFSEDVFDASSLKHGTNGTTGDQAGTGRSGLKKDLATISNTHDVVRDRVALEFHGHEVLFGVLGALFNRIGNLVSLAVTDANATFTVTDNTKSGEAETTATFNDLGATVDENNLFNQLVTMFVERLRNLAGTAIFTTWRTLLVLLLASGGGGGNSAHRLEYETTLASGISEDFNFTVVESAGAIEHHRGDTGGLGFDGKGNPEGFGTGDVG